MFVYVFMWCTTYLWCYLQRQDKIDEEVEKEFKEKERSKSYKSSENCPSLRFLVVIRSKVSQNVEWKSQFWKKSSDVWSGNGSDLICQRFLVWISIWVIFLWVIKSKYYNNQSFSRQFLEDLKVTIKVHTYLKKNI